MKYMGGKFRLAKYIVPIMLEKRSPDQYWVEPFVGGGNILDKVGGKRIGADINKYTIEALISIRDYVHELPKNNTEFTEEDYRKLKLSDDYKHKGFAGYAYSFGGKFLNGWGKNKVGLDYVNEAYRGAVKQNPKLQGVHLLCSSYLDLRIPPKSLIYCDPPYFGTTKYKNMPKFDHADFWQWCREKVKEGHTVFVSEYNAPNDFECIWQKEIKMILDLKSNRKINVEKLFIYKGTE